ncbi:MAG TPA: HK97 gp10 family phage protein [Vicinamibacterales bacterium]|nr:HK97 gp10 family phage protein [Vicinamibacterales bacterium]
MATLSVKWDGLDTFKQELQVLTGNLVSEAEGILTAAANEAADALRAAYPYREGGLRRGVTVIPSRGRTLAGAEVKNLAPHAGIYEDGTTTRATHQGYNRGRMLGTPTFRPITARYRDRALSTVIDRIYAHGAAHVTGDPDTD